MNFRIVLLLIILSIYLISEIYLVFNLRFVFKESRWATWMWIGYGITVAFVVGSILFALASFSQGEESTPNRTFAQNLLIGLMFTLVVSKLILALLFLLVDTSRMLVALTSKINSWVSSNPREFSLASRRKFLLQIAIGLSAIPFASFLYGITVGKYNFKVKKQKLSFANLPKIFDGYKVVQISDIHSGSFDSIEAIERGVQMINDLKPDLIVFTGDLINDLAEEIDPYIDTFKSLKAKDGIYSITGNHDYGEYAGLTEDAKAKNFEELIKKHPLLGFQLLMNESVKIKREDAHFNLVGVENWGLPPFPQKGDLNKAMQGVDNNFTLLLSHDPSHWDAQILSYKNEVDLTLSGHTHGMQFGIEIPGIKWSPVKYKYPRWAGLYQKEDKYLYVNRGFGFLGFPGRVGIWPEITLLELQST